MYKTTAEQKAHKNKTLTGQQTSRSISIAGASKILQFPKSAWIVGPKDDP